MQRGVALSQESLLGHISRLSHGRANFKQLVKEFGLKGDSKDRLDELLGKLADKGELIELRSGHYQLASLSREYIVGRLNMHRDGYGFVISKHPIKWIQGDLFIPPESASEAMHGDQVLARVGRVEENGRADGEIVRILKRAHTTVVGQFHVGRHGCYVTPHDERLNQSIEIPDGMEIPGRRATVDRVGVAPISIESVEQMDGMIVNVELVEFSRGGENPVGRVIEVLGSPDDFGIDVEIIIRKFHIPHEFPPEVLEEARSFSSELPESDIAGRQDFRGMEIVTIDGETARDFDDAVWVDRLPNGNYALHVHIADVSYYVRPETPIDEEAQRRGTSVYFPDRAVPMLPVELSTDLCSLKPQVDRFVMSALMEIDNKGDVVSQEFTRGIIRSVERMTYTNVHRLLEENDPELQKRYETLLPRFQLMKELALKLNRKRVRRGSIDFDLPEPLIEFDTQGEMIGVVRTPRNIAHRIIEEFMLTANEAVAGHLESAGVPSMYRIHEQPDAKRIADFEEVAAQFGYSLGVGAIPVKKFRNTERRRDGRKVTTTVELTDPKVEISSRAYQKLIAKLEGTAEERILTYLMLRSLKQARYSNENRGHFALAATSYTHFTSPIRRYPDLIVHRLLGEYLDRRTTSLSDEQLQAWAEDCSIAERRADEAERELMEWKKARFMESRVGEEFDGMIISTTRFGFFVELAKYFIEGLVPIDTLPGDTYRFHENVRKIIAERSRREFSIGDKVRVVLERVEAIERKLTFGLVEPEPRSKKVRRRYS